MPTTWCVTGSRPPAGGYTEGEVARCVQMFAAFWRPGDKLITGGCQGVDAIAMRYAHEHGLHVLTLLPRDKRFTDLDAVRLYSDEVEDTGLKFWARDRLEVERAAKVLALPLSERVYSRPTSGTWHTWDVAGDASKQSCLMVIRPAGTWEILGPDANRLKRALAGLAT